MDECPVGDWCELLATLSESEAGLYSFEHVADSPYVEDPLTPSCFPQIGFIFVGNQLSAQREAAWRR